MIDDNAIKPQYAGGVVAFEVLLDEAPDESSDENNLPSAILDSLKKNSIIVENVLVVCWISLFVTLIDRNSFFTNLPVTLLGVFGACLANCVPIGGGVIYIPALSWLGLKIQLGVAFSISTMMVGNGIFGFLHWNKKNSDLIILESFLWTVLPSSVGSVFGILVLGTLKDERFLKLSFSLFCGLLSIFVMACSVVGGVEEFMQLLVSSRQSIQKPTRNLQTVFPHHSISIQAKLAIIFVSFFAGVYLVPNIAVGPALTTYVLLVLVGYGSKEAMVTGIVTGGWVCIVPFLIHLFILHDVPFQLWVMIIPGIYIGAKVTLTCIIFSPPGSLLKNAYLLLQFLLAYRIGSAKCAPHVHDKLGARNLLSLFGIFLFASAILFFLH